MGESWRVTHGPDIRTADVADALRRDGRAVATWYDSDNGRSLAFVSNGSRAMVMLIDEPGDPGCHAIDPSASDATSSGFVLENGQEDTYADADTLPLAAALEAAQQVLATGQLSRLVTWHEDR